jgi:hypothetical protein
MYYLSYQFDAVHLDDILIYSRYAKDHVDHVRQVFEKLQQHGFYRKLPKCELFKSIVSYLGHIISSEGIRPDTKKITVVKYWPTPKSVFDVRSFLGLANYFRRYIEIFQA